MTSQIILLSVLLLVFLELGQSISYTSTRTKKQLGVTYPNLVFFGDSPTDVGNLYAASNGRYPEPPDVYFEGRVSNSFVWSEILTTALGLSSNMTEVWAWVSATSDSSYAPSPYQDITIPGIKQQVEDFLLQTGGKVNSSTLFLFQFSGLDYQVVAEPNPSTSVSNYFAAIESIYAAGGRRFVVFAGAYVPPKYSQQSNYQTLVETHNSQVLQKYNQFRSKHIDLDSRYYDLGQRIQDIQTNTDAFGIVEKTVPCVDLTTIQVCEDPSQYLFYDELNWGPTLHQLVSDDVLFLLSSSESNTLEEPVLTVNYYFGGMIPADATCSCK